MLEITIPVLNEENSLEENTLIALNYVKNEVTKNCRIVIADNGSTDNTEEIGRKLERENLEIQYIKVHKKGVGLALRTSWLQSNADIVGYMDLDLATNLDHLKEVHTILANDECDIVNGSRLLDGSQVIGRSWYRSLTSRVFNIIVRKLLKVNLSDGMSGFKFFKRKIATDLINSGINLDGWFFSTEILVKAFWSGKKIIEIPIIWTDGMESKVKVAKLSREYLFEIFRLRNERTSFLEDSPFQ